jgi:hypothetical protein
MEVTMTMSLLFVVGFLFFSWLLLNAHSKRRIVAFVLVGAMAAVLVAPPPAQAQASLLQSIQSVLNAINGAIQKALKSINSVQSDNDSFYQKVIWRIESINQARAQVTQMVGKYRSLMSSILNMNLRSATLSTPMALETVIRDHQTGNFDTLTTAYGSTYGALPTPTSASASDRAMADMDDAVTLENLKTLKASDQMTDLTLHAADQLEDGAGQAAPGSAPFLTVTAVVASIESQAVTQKMLAAELRQEAARAAHDNAIRKQGAGSTSQLRGIITSLLQRK